MTYTTAVIGTGAHPDDQGDGFSMGYRHAEGYVSHPDCELVAGSDIVLEHAEAFTEEFGLNAEDGFEDHREMLDVVAPDVVSIATPPATHKNIVLDCARGGVKAIHCEKPMATTWSDCRLMAQECLRRDVQLTFNHQLRVSEPIEHATKLLEEGEIGELRRVEVARGDLLERGIHQLDLCSHFADDSPVEWVLAGIDYREENIRYGFHNENQGVVHWRHENGVHGLATTGEQPEMDIVGCGVRLVGTEGEIELQGDVPLRVRRDGIWESPDIEGGAPVEPAIAHIVDALKSGEESLLSARRGLVGHEIVFAAWESVRQRGRVDLPLCVADNPLEAMVENGDLTPK